MTVFTTDGRPATPRPIRRMIQRMAEGVHMALREHTSKATYGALMVPVTADARPSRSPSPSPSPEVQLPTWHAPEWLTPWTVGAFVGVLLGVALVLKFMFSGASARSGQDGGRLSLRARLWLRLHPGRGFAHEWELRSAYGLSRPRREAKRLRPSLTWRDRILGDPRAYAIHLGVHRVAHRLWAGLETGVLVLGIPRSGKSSWLVGRIIDAPGAVMATSLRGDLVKKTIVLRAAPAARGYRPLTPLPSLLAALLAAVVTSSWWPAVLGAAALAWLAERLISVRLARRHLAGRPYRPVWVLDPQNVSGHGKALPFSPVVGCEDPQLARSTAAYMVEAVQAGGVQNAAFWENSAAQALRGLLHAAALGGYTMMHLYHWVLEADETPLRVLRADPRTAPGKAAEVQQFLELPEETRKGVQKTLGNVLDFLSDPRIAASVCSPQAGSFDVDHLIATHGTLFMVADDRAHSTVGPLFAALAGRVMDRAHELAAAGRAERLDPQLTVILDEVADTCPGPLATWARTSAGWGIVLMAAVHNPDQLVAKWGPSVARDIYSSLTLKIAWGGQTVAEHAEMISFMCGTLRARSMVADGRGGYSHEVPVVTASEVMQLPRNYAIVVAARSKPTIVRTERAWRRKDVKASAGRPVPGYSPAVEALATAPPPPYATDPAQREVVRDADISALLEGQLPPAPPRSFGQPGPAAEEPPAERRRPRRPWDAE